jgi:hypothetical protein
LPTIKLIENLDWNDRLLRANVDGLPIWEASMIYVLRHRRDDRDPTLDEECIFPGR